MSASFVELQPNQTGKKIRSFENASLNACAVTAVDAIGLSNAYVQIAADSTGKKIQHFQNTISGQTVHALAVVLVDESGAAI
jgi:hypothetical protein